MPNLKYVDLFAGCGGLSLGLEQAGFTPVYVNELNKDAMDSYLMNRREHFPYLDKYKSYDIKEAIQDEAIFVELSKEDIDVVCGGPPCQGFSNIGIRRSYSVEKKQLPSNHLFEDMAYFIHKIRPKVFIFENVEGLLRSKWTATGDKGEIFEDVLTTFRKIPDYEVKFKLLHAKDYGVPQRRPRIIVVGVRDGLITAKSDVDDAVEAGFLPEPSNHYPDLIDVLSDLVDEKFEYGGKTTKYPYSAQSDFQKYLRTKPDGTIAKKGDAITDHGYSNHSKRIRRKFQAMINNDGIIPQEFRTKKFAQRLLQKKWGDKGPSITLTSLPDDYVHFSQARSLSVREWARIQTFPDWYQFSGKRTTGGIRRAGNPRESIFDRDVPKYTQIGNAVPVKLATAIGQHLRNLLN
jgi:DNA (cytosine-5)-methyltransferase 1